MLHCNRIKMENKLRLILWKIPHTLPKTHKCKYIRPCLLLYVIYINLYKRKTD